MRICLVTPFAWSQPHDVNEHVAGVAAALRELGHTVTVLAPSTRAADLLRGRRALASGRESRRDRRRPGRPDLAPLADGRAGRRAREPRARARTGRVRRRARLRAGPAVALLPRAARHRRARRRDLLLGRPPRLSAGPLAAREAARRASTRCSRSPSRCATPRPERFPGDYRVLSPGRRPRASSPRRAEAAADRRRAAPERARRRARSHPLAARAAGLGGRAAAHDAARRAARDPARPRRARPACAPRVDGAARAPILDEAAIFVPGVDGLARLLLEAQAAGCAIAAPRGLEDQPELAAAATARLAEDDELRASEGANGAAAAERPVVRRRSPARARGALLAALRPRRRLPRTADPLADRPWIVADLHMHTSWSFDCAVDPAELVDHAEPRGSARSPSPTTTSSAARSRRSRPRAAAT